MRLFSLNAPNGALILAAAVYSSRDSSFLCLWFGTRSFRILLNNNRPHDIARGAW